jgi:hypothetical protein
MKSGGMKVAMRLAAAGLIAPLLVAISGCGMEGAPLPPTLKLPQPVTTLSGERIGDEVHLSWTMPKRDTDKVLLKGDQKVHVCRRIENGGCDPAGDLMIAPGTAASYVDHLPSSITSGPQQLLVYTVLLQNHSGHDAGPSNAIYAVTGIAPRPIENLSTAASPDGVVLHWTAPNANADQELIRIHRTLVVDPKAKKPGQKSGLATPVSQAQVQDQTLEVTTGDKGQALDRDAALDNTYRYTVERVRRFSIQGHAFEETSTPSESITLDARDIFPPQVPSSVQAVADAETHAIDLSWIPDTDADIAGYIVYRRDSGSSQNPVRVSPPGVVAPSFRDASTLPGHGYVYSVSAIDRDGNESARSADVEESLPQQ